MSEPDLQAVVAAVAAAKKYRGVCPETVRRIAARELAARGSVKAAVKATKRRLHQVYGAFEHDLNVDAAYDRLAAARRRGDEEWRAACRAVLALHSSTRERLPILERFYPALWEIAGRPATLLDLGCGLNPLAWPWMGLPPGTEYVPLDIDCGRVEFLNRFLALAGLVPRARCQDLLAQPPGGPADVAMLLKMSPTLERQEEGATVRLVAAMQAPCVVVSFAVASLTGRHKGMEEQYGSQFEALARGQNWRITELRYETELVFVVQR
jgi:16S rRNA (guanine(1405)-N(7))-methyltransferase